MNWCLRVKIGVCLLTSLTLERRRRDGRGEGGGGVGIGERMHIVCSCTNIHLRNSLIFYTKTHFTFHFSRLFFYGMTKNDVLFFWLIITSLSLSRSLPPLSPTVFCFCSNNHLVLPFCPSLSILFGHLWQCRSKTRQPFSHFFLSSLNSRHLER